MTFSPQVPDLTLAATGLMAARTPAAVVYCEGHFSGLDGKTAHGLVRHCDAYAIRAVIDSQCAGLDTGLLLDGVANGIPVVANLAAARALWDRGAAP